MRFFSFLYAKVMKWAEHRHAPRYLAGLSFAESTFFPIPPDVMLAPMVLAKPKSAWYYASITTIFSTLGGMAGYLIGRFLFDMVDDMISYLGYIVVLEQVQIWFDNWGFWVIFLVGFSPIPYKIFTIGAGLIGMAFLPFALASLIGRGARFFLVAGFIYWGGEKIRRVLDVYVERIGFATIILAIIAYAIYQLI